MYDQNYDAYEALCDFVLESHPEYAAERLNAMYAEAQRPKIDPAWLAAVPAHLQGFAATLDPELFAEVSLMPPHLRDQLLERGMQLQEFEQQQRQAREADADRQFEGVMTTAGESLKNLHDECMAGHWIKMEQALPFSDKEAGKKIHSLIIDAAMHQVFQDQEAQVMRHNICAHLAHAQFKRAVGEQGSLSHDSAARDLAYKLNARLTQFVDAYIGLFKNNFGVMAAPMQTQPQQQEYVN
jgi:hypothetical protein